VKTPTLDVMMQGGETGARSPGRASKRSRRTGAIVRPCDLGIPRSQLARLVARGEAERVARGLYRLAGAEPTTHHTVALVAKRVPHGIICLISALSIHEIGTHIPHDLWLAVDRKARKPVLGGLPVRIVRFSAATMRLGIERRLIEGVPVVVTSPARTVVDCFRYRNKVGLDVALEALSDALRTRKVTIAALDAMASTCRARTVLKPYLEAMAWR
jgi:predicted transcriptional regulator of viral defense system